MISVNTSCFRYLPESYCTKISTQHMIYYHFNHQGLVKYYIYNSSFFLKGKKKFNIATFYLAISKVILSELGTMDKALGV